MKVKHELVEKGKEYVRAFSTKTGDEQRDAAIQVCTLLEIASMLGFNVETEIHDIPEYEKFRR